MAVSISGNTIATLRSISYFAKQFSANLPDWTSHIIPKKRVWVNSIHWQD